MIGGWTWPWALSPVPLAFALAILGLIAIVAGGMRRTREGDSTIIAFSLFAIPSFRNRNIAALVVSLGEFGIILSLPLLLPFLFVYGFGVGLATAQLTGVVLQDVPVTESGQASGTQSTARQVGSALGIAILGTVLFTSTAGLLSSKLDASAFRSGSATRSSTRSSTAGGGAVLGLERGPQTAPAAEAAKQAFSEGTRYAAFSSAGFLVFGLLATLSLGGASSTSGRRRAIRTVTGHRSTGCRSRQTWLTFGVMPLT